MGHVASSAVQQCCVRPRWYCGTAAARRYVVRWPFPRAPQYFYRSVKPCVHYIPIWERHEKDVYDVLDALPHQDELAQRVGGPTVPTPSRTLPGSWV